MNSKLASKLERATVPQKPERDPDTFTTGEYAEQFNISRTLAKRRIRALLERGLVTPVKLKIINELGHVVGTSGYKFIGEQDSNAGANG